LPLLPLFRPSRRSNSAMRACIAAISAACRQQQGDEVGLRQLLKGGALHRILGIGPPRSCQPKPCSSPSVSPHHRIPRPPRPWHRSSSPRGYLGAVTNRQSMCLHPRRCWLDRVSDRICEALKVGWVGSTWALGPPFTLGAIYAIGQPDIGDEQVNVKA
jgi:hypothetical protein